MMPLSSSLFSTAFSEVADAPFALWGPESFRDYLAKQGLPETARTAQHISVDSVERLDPFLRERDVMVLRLGASSGTGTQFALVRAAGRLSDFFLVDAALFGNTTASTFLPTAGLHKLYPFRLLPSTSETSLVNFAFASGLLAHALGLDEQEVSAPATGASIYTFDVRPHSALEAVVTHQSGQVQVDCLFVGKREGQQVLFVVEAKSSALHKSLAKHKLVYPILALSPRVPTDMPVVPVYMKVSEAPDGLHFLVAECQFPDARVALGGLDELQAGMCKHFVVPSSMEVFQGRNKTLKDRELQHPL